MRVRVARRHDVFVGYCPICDRRVTGILLGDTSSSTVDNCKIALIGGTAVGRCGHRTIIVAGSSQTMAESRKVAYVGAPVANAISGHIISGSGSTSMGV